MKNTLIRVGQKEAKYLIGMDNSLVGIMRGADGETDYYFYNSRAANDDLAVYWGNENGIEINRAIARGSKKLEAIQEYNLFGLTPPKL